MDPIRKFPAKYLTQEIPLLLVLLLNEQPFIHQPIVEGLPGWMGDEETDARTNGLPNKSRRPAI